MTAATAQQRRPQWTRWQGTIYALLSWSTIAFADGNNGVVFIYPTEGQIYNTMDTINVTYTSPFPSPNLYLWSDGGDRKILMQPVPGSGTVQILLNFTSGSPCWFNLRPGTEAGYGANSPAFNVIGQERKPESMTFGPESSTTTSTTSTTSTTESTSTTTSTTTPITTPTPTTTSTTETGSTTPTQTPPPVHDSPADSSSGSTPSSISDSAPDTSGGGLTAAAAAGIGAGVAVGVLAVACALFAWLWRRRMGRRADTAEDGDDGSQHSSSSPVGSHSSLVYVQPEKRRSEIMVQPSEVRHEKRLDHPRRISHRAELSSVNTPPEIASSQVLEPPGYGYRGYF